MPQNFEPERPYILMSRAPQLGTPTSTPNKRKHDDDLGQSSKRAKGPSVTQHASSLPPVAEATIEAEDETVGIRPHTPTNLEPIQEPATPIPNALSGVPTTPKPKVHRANPGERPAGLGDPEGTEATPLRFSGSNIDPSSKDPRDSGGRLYDLQAQQPNKSNQSQRSNHAEESNKGTRLAKDCMERVLKYELYDHVFEHRDFVGEFFASNDEGLSRWRKCILPLQNPRDDTYLAFDEDARLWNIASEITEQWRENNVYEPLAKMLNTIGRTAHDIYKNLFPNEQFRLRYHPFHDHSTRSGKSDVPSDDEAKPDLVMGAGRDLEKEREDNEKSGEKEGENRKKKAKLHWGDVDLVIECKRDSSDQSRADAYMQLARYTRLVFANQIYRLHVFGFSLCGSIVNFVRFDRSRMIHSSDIDISTPQGAHLFVEGMAALLTLSPEKFGYDTHFSFAKDEATNKLETMFTFKADTRAQVAHELLCFRKCIIGRATCVFTLGDDVLKSIWRPKDRPDEGVTLSHFQGVYGVCQVKDYRPNAYSTELRYPNQLAHSPFRPSFWPEHKESQVYGPRVSSIRTTSTTASASQQPVQSDQQVLAPAPQEPQLEDAQTLYERGLRVRSDILMLRGGPLSDAENSLHLLIAIKDGLMGIMAFTEAGKLHCDVSAFNMLLVHPREHYGERGWLSAPTYELQSSVWDRTAKHGRTTATTVQHAASAKQESPRLERAKDEKRGPLCVLHDTEFTVDEDRPEDEVHTDRTGTPAFISAQLLLNFMADKGPVVRTFIHDVESLLWVLVWVVAHRSQRESRPRLEEKDKHAKKIISELSQHNIEKLGEKKRSWINASAILRRDILNLDNDWSNDLAPVIARLASFFDSFLYFEPADPTFLEPWEVTRQATQDEFRAMSRSQIFDHIFGILDREIKTLEAKYTVSVLSS